MTYKIAFSAGEFSGDEHLSELLTALRDLIPEAEFRGLAGPKTRASGFATELAIEDYASVMGFVEVLSAAPRIFSALRWFKTTFTSWKPDLLILVDYPDFNFRLARIAKASGAKVIHYIPPKVWAWRAGRVKTIAELIDRVALIFPFEKEFFEKSGYDRSIYVGHPFHGKLTRETHPEIEERKRQEFIRSLKLDPSKPSLAFFPGSRPSEIKRHWHGMVAGLQELLKRAPETQVLLSVAAPVADLVNEFLKQTPLVCHKVENTNLDILRFSDVGFIKSGTSNLQAAFYELPFVMYYQASFISEMVVRTLVHIKEFSLVNIIRPGTVVELLQRSAQPVTIANELESLIRDPKKRADLKSALREVHMQLETFEPLKIFEGCATPPQRAAKLALELILPTK